MHLNKQQYFLFVLYTSNIFEMIKIILLAAIFIGIGFIGLGINILFRKGRKFPETSVGKNKKMRELGLNCTKADEIKCRSEIDHLSGCAGCGCA